MPYIKKILGYSESTAIWLHDVVQSNYFTTQFDIVSGGTTFRLHDEKTDEVKWEKTVARNENAIGLNDKYLTMNNPNGSWGQQDLKVFDLETGACVLNTRNRL